MSFRARASTGDQSQVGAPFSGVVNVRVRVGDTVTAGQTVATIEAMKMKASITTSISGIVSEVAIERVAQVEGGDLLLTIRRTKIARSTA